MDENSTLKLGLPGYSGIDNRSLGRAQTLSKQDVKTEKQIDKAVSGFEALLLHEMLKAMWSTVEPAGLMGEDSNASQIYRDMFNQAIADSIAEGRGIGVKKIVKDEIVKRQGASKSQGNESG